MSNPVAEPRRKLRPRQAGLDPSGSLDCQPRTLFSERAVQKRRFEKALLAFTIELFVV